MDKVGIGCPLACKVLDSSIAFELHGQPVDRDFLPDFGSKNECPVNVYDYWLSIHIVFGLIWMAQFINLHDLDSRAGAAVAKATCNN